MRNIILFLLHFSIISHLKHIDAIKTQISHGRSKNSKCFISNYNLYNSTLTNDLVSKKSHENHIKGLESERIVKETGNDSKILVESPTIPLKSIVDKGSIKSSSIRHEILDKESLLDELIVSKDNFKDAVTDLNKKGSKSGQKMSYSPKKFEEVFKALESTVLKKTVDKKEQVIKPSDKIMKRRSKETIYTRLQNYVKSSEPFLTKHNLLEEVKSFVHLLHWNVWHTGSFDGSRACNWTSGQFARFSNLMNRIDNIINEEIKSFLLTTTNTDQDLIGGVLEERTNFVFSTNYVYNKLRELVEFGEFDLYKDRLTHLYYIKCKIVSSLRKIISSLIFDPRETELYKKYKRRFLNFKNHMRNLKFNLYSKLNKTRIFMNKFPTPNSQKNLVNKPEEVGEQAFDKIDLHFLLKHLSHSYIAPQNLKRIEDITREDLYKSKEPGNWSLYFVGSGSRQPTSTRLTSTMAFRRTKRGGPIWLFDCGEGTKNGLEKLGLDPCQVERIFLTHLHGDHCYGLFSFLYLRERTKNLEIYGPPGTRKLINSVHHNTSTSTYSMFNIHELVPKSKNNTDSSGSCSAFGSGSFSGTGGSTTSNFNANTNSNSATTSSSSSNTATGSEEGADICINNEGYYSVFKEDNVEILAADLDHTMPTVGYVIQERDTKESPGKTFNINIISTSSDTSTQNTSNSNTSNTSSTNSILSNTVFLDPKFYDPVFLKNNQSGLKGRVVKKIAICQDSCDSSKMKKIAMGADVLIHEATLSSTSSLVSGILLDIIRDNSDLVLSKGSVKKLCNFLCNIETKLGCFNFTLSALSSFVKCERYYLLQKLNIIKNFISTFKPFDKEFADNHNVIEGKNKKEVEKMLKEKWLSNVFTLMDRLNVLNELNKNEYFIKRLQNRYKLMEKLSKVVPTLDLNKVIDTASRKLIFSKILENQGSVNNAYERFNISKIYKDKFIVDVPKYLNSVSGDIFEYWNEILQLNLSSQSDSNFEDSIDPNWRLLYDSIIGSFGHSTPNMAGRFANEIHAKKLILTHFSNKYPGDEKFENLLTMIRIENEARMGYFKNGNTKTIPVIAAWDKMKLKL